MLFQDRILVVEVSLGFFIQSLTDRPYCSLYISHTMFDIICGFSGLIVILLEGVLIIRGCYTWL
ncbi:hypothetical protein BJX99DRAFT_236458 [Aspergillus californicus]